MSLLQALIAAKLSGDDGGGGSVTPASIVAATEQMNDDQKHQTCYNLGAMFMGDMVREFVLMAVDGGNLVLDLESRGGIQYFASSYAAGMNVIFALPMLYLDQTAAGNDILSMQPMGIDQDNGVFHLEGVRGGKRYYARMAPISANVLSGPLVIRDELPSVTAADNGSILRVVNGSWAATTLHSAESEAY